MSRLPRIKADGEQGWYHLHARVAGVRGRYPLQETACRRKLSDLLQRFSGLYMCEMAAFCVMGNHWHAVMHFQAPFALEEGDLAAIAAKFYPGKAGQKMLASWTEEHWQRFAGRIFDVSEFMRNVQMAFAKWYNRTHDRSGRFWGERFGSTLLEDEKSVLDCMLYIELNPARAGICALPRRHKGSSAFLRAIGKDKWLMNIDRVLASDSEQQARREYNHLLTWRGTEPTRKGQARIPAHIAREEERRGYRDRGAFLKRVGHLTEGLAVGCHQFVNEKIASMKERGYYLRRCNPIKPEDSPHRALRPQRQPRE